MSLQDQVIESVNEIHYLGMLSDNMINGRYKREDVLLKVIRPLMDAYLELLVRFQNSGKCLWPSHLGKQKAWKQTSSTVDFLKMYWAILSVPLIDLR
jgi:hypothetical protein